jgi:hypothetical protein
MIELIERELYLKWKKHLLSNLQDVELYDLSLNISGTNNKSLNQEEESILTVTYLIKLDPRIHENAPIIYKLISTINSTLKNPHKNVYSDLASMLPHDTSKLPIAIVLPTSQISRNSFSFCCENLFHFTDSSFPSNSIVSRDNFNQFNAISTFLILVNNNKSKTNPDVHCNSYNSRRRVAT